MRKPPWLNKKIDLKACHTLKLLLKDLKLHTICEEAGCPNISECFSKRTATFLILGDICTRNCRFCGVKKGKPCPVDEGEPERVAEAVRRLNLRHVVITSVTRDDLPDGGAEQFAQTILSIKKTMAKITIEVLIPDFKGNRRAIERVIETGPDVIGHNIETVPRLYPDVRQAADYFRSLEVLKTVKTLSNGIYTKSGLMLGLGEEEGEVLEVFKALREAECDFLSLGQYLPPSLKAYPVKEYIHPDKFDDYKEKALSLGFLYVASGPYVRSSYLAEEYLK
ncbi:MAG: lipoyl synthase [Candidatus Desulfofervidaceae bacterium]|nr:lipoyl synthase [Candidatus Desulfofervidaceae bacterium]